MERYGLTTVESMGSSLSGCTPEALRAFFDQFDADGSGTINWREFVEIFKSQLPHAAPTPRQAVAAAPPLQQPQPPPPQIPLPPEKPSLWSPMRRKHQGEG